MESELDFESYSRQELLKIYEVIDRQAYPERFQKGLNKTGIFFSREHCHSVRELIHQMRICKVIKCYTVLS